MRSATLIRLSVCAALFGSATLVAQSSPPQAQESNKAAAYYNFAMGHYYAELAGAYGNRGSYLDKAIEHYRAALKLDPGAGYILEELTEVYVQSNNLRAAVTEAEELLKQDPENLQARRMLGRIYTRLIGDTRQNAINDEMLRRSLEQYAIITQKEPDDVESWVTLGRLHRVGRNSVEARRAFQKAIELDAENEDALTGLAMVYSDVGDTKAMVETLNRVADKSPNLRTLTQLASAYEQMRDYAGAAEVLRKAVALSPDNPQLLKALAQSLLYSEQFDDALEIYQQLVEAEPKEAQWHVRLAEIYRYKRDYTKARASLTRAKELDRNSLEIRYDEVSLLEAEGKIDEALALMRSVLDDTAKTSYNESERSYRAMLVERLGVMYRSAHEYDKAVETFRQMAALAPETGPRGAVQVVDTYRASKSFDKAEAESRAALDKYPQDRVVKVVHATLLADLGRSDEGASMIRPLIDGERDREMYLTLAQIHEKGKNFGEMAKALDEAEKLSTSPADRETVVFMRGAMLERQKQYDRAEAEFRRVIELNPKNAGALNYLGYMLADRNVRLDEAKQLIVKALEIDPDNGAYLDSLGWAYFRLGRLDEAETYLLRSLDRTSGDPTVHDHLGDVYFEQGRLKDAIAQWQLSLKEWQASSKADTDANEIAKVTKKLESARVRLAKENSGAKR
ncbi:MAG: tetratricopeptide repeat protein [Bryobacterales bacterium]|nr:tetratricopeptide repeat protein [Bryobacterales bacterium]